MLEDNVEAVDTAATAADAQADAFADAAASVSTPAGQFTSEDIAKARQQEKAKVYGTVEKLQEELAFLRKREEERVALEADKAAKRQAREAERAAEAKAKAEEEMSFKQLLKNKETEWQSQLDAERQERERAFALLEREREFQELQSYRAERIQQERDNIIPELIDLISGNTKDEIEQSVLALKAKSAQIFDSVANVAQQSRKDMVGTRVTVPASGPLDNDSAQSSFTPENIANMSQAEYAKHRQKLIGSATNRGQGLFG
jgi:hypothetical protein